MSRGRPLRPASLALGVAVALALAAGCTSAPPSSSPPPPSNLSATANPAAPPDRSGPPAARTDPSDPRLDAALSDPREDSVYPHVGDPGVDALHYNLDLLWDPDQRRLEASETLLLRATRSARSLRLDLGEPLRVGAVRLDGGAVDFRHRGKDLVVRASVREDDRYTLRLTYAGTPRTVRTPSTRRDVASTGWHITPEGQTWTMQEPFGAYSWYAVNDQPADKALYDITLTVPSPWVGIANGELLERTETGTSTRTRWHLAQPAASYLVTVATGPFTATRDTSAAGVPITYWTRPSLPARRLRRLRATPEAMSWLTARLGPYPFDTLGLVVVDARSAMETQTMITLGDTDYTTSRAVVVHELAHHWYGNQVTPQDWRDVWMSEGMATYLQLLWESEHGGPALAPLMADIARGDQGSRRYAGPPGAYDADKFGDGNVYYSPALMWHRLRKRLGDRAFWALVRAWPAARDDQSTGRADYWAWMSRRSGVDLTGFFEAWLLSESSPATAARRPPQATPRDPSAPRPAVGTVPR